MEPAKRSPRTFIPGIVTDLDSSWKRCYRKMRLDKVPLLTPRTIPGPAHGKIMNQHYSHLPSPSDSLKKKDPSDAGDYFSFNPMSGSRSTVSSRASAECIDLTNRPILTPTSNRSRYTFPDSEKLATLTPPTSAKSSRCFRLRQKGRLQAPQWPLPRSAHSVSFENADVFAPHWTRTQVDGMDDAGKDYLPSPEPSPPSSRLGRLNLSEESFEKDADGDIVLPDADAPRRHKSALRSSMSIDLTSPVNAAFPSPNVPTTGLLTPLVPACPAIEHFPPPPVYYGEDPLTPLSLSRWAPASESSLRAKIASKRRDRFIPPRKSPTSSRESLRLSIPANNLSDFERTARQRHPASDPFSHLVPRSSRVQESFQSLRRQEPGARGSSSPLNLNNPLALRHGTRQVSDGAVWNVGGSAVVTDSVSGIPDGRGGMFTSGTNAPLHTSMFLTEGDTISEQEAHENRLAYAMGIDQASRVLGSFENQSASMPPTPTGEHWSIHGPKSPTWVDCEWTKPGSFTSGLSLVANAKILVLTCSQSLRRRGRRRSLCRPYRSDMLLL